MGFVHKIPRELQQEDRWFKIFSPKQAIAAAICVVIVMFTGTQLVRIMGVVPMIAIETIFITLCGLGIFLKLPQSNYIIGGQYAVIVLLRVIYRKTHRVIFVKHYE